MKLIVVSLTIAAFCLGATQAAPSDGNGAPSGPHYNLNILGKVNCSPEDLTGSERHTIQVLLVGGDKAGDLNGALASEMSKKNKIFLVPSEVEVGDSDFHVIDGNACDGDGALFALPQAVASAWTIWARAGGKPDGTATMTLCATVAGEDGVLGTGDDEVVCSTANVVLLRDKGRKFVDVTQQLTTITLPDVGTVSLFDDPLREYFWNYDNNGLRLAQLRFYPVEETPSATSTQ